MKTLGRQTDTVGIESEETVLSSVAAANGEGTEYVGTETPVVGENVSAKVGAKKKVKIVKKIVKRKVIKKVPKRVSAALDCNDSCKVLEASNPNDDVPVAIESFVSAEIKKSNAVVDALKKVENIESKDSNGANGVRLVKEIHVPVNGDVNVGVDSCGGECERSGLVTAAVSKDHGQTERHDREHDDNNVNVEVEAELGIDERAEKSSKLSIEVIDGHEGEESLKVQGEKSECVGVEMDIQLTNDVKGEEGIVRRETEHTDLTLGDAVESQVGAEQLIENIEIGSLNDRRLLSGGMNALERQLRRQAEIFISGLDEETKEEDVRKPFEEIGEVIEVRFVVNRKTGKNKGFGFIRYASAADAKSALRKYQNIEIRGRQCRTAAVERKDTIFLWNIYKKWNNKYILALLQKAGIRRTKKVSVVSDPGNTELKRAFAILEFKTTKDAQTAYRKLQKKDVFGRHSKIKVAWTEPLIEPDSEEVQNIKSVYAEDIPSSWDEEEVRDYFKLFGKIGTVALSKNLGSTKRKNFAFINYESCEAALACVEAFTSKRLMTRNDPKVDLKVSFAKSTPKGKRISQSGMIESTQSSKIKQKEKRAVFKPREPRNVRVSTVSGHEDARTDSETSTTIELVQLLREQASWKPLGPSSTIGSSTGTCRPSSGGKRPFPDMGSESFYHDPRIYQRARLENCNPVNPRSAYNGIAMASYHPYNQQGASYTPGLFDGVDADPRYFQTREQTRYHGSSSIHRGMHY